MGPLFKVDNMTAFVNITSNISTSVYEKKEPCSKHNRKYNGFNGYNGYCIGFGNYIGVCMDSIGGCYLADGNHSILLE